MLFPRRPSSHLCFLVVFLLLRLSPHTKQSPHLPLPPEQPCTISWDAVAWSQCALPPSYQDPSAEAIIVPCYSLDSTYWLLLGSTSNALPPSFPLPHTLLPTLLPWPPSLASPTRRGYRTIPAVLGLSAGTCALCSSSLRPGEGTGSWNAHTISNLTAYYRCC